MYIRRKVYSVLTDDYGYERLFSTNDIVLDDYEDTYVDDRLFAERDRDWADAALGAGAGLGVGGAMVGAYHGAKAMEAKRSQAAETALRDFLKSKEGKALGISGAKKNKLEAIQEQLGQKLKGRAKKINGIEREELQKMLDKTKNPGKAGKLANWVNEKIIGTAAEKGSKKAGTGLFKGNKKLALAAALAAPAIAGTGIAYGVGHKAQD